MFHLKKEKITLNSIQHWIMEKFYILELKQFGEKFPPAMMVILLRVHAECSVFRKFNGFINRNNSVFHFLHVHPCDFFICTINIKFCIELKILYFTGILCIFYLFFCLKFNYALITSSLLQMCLLHHCHPPKSLWEHQREVCSCSATMWPTCATLFTCVDLKSKHRKTSVSSLQEEELFQENNGEWW